MLSFLSKIFILAIVQADKTMLKGLSLKCLDGCAYCCLCPPEVMSQERDFFERNQPGALSETEMVHSGRRSQSIKLRGNIGACNFLKDKRCTLYEHRPHMCQQYPISIYVSRRIQPTPILSCRGLAPSNGTNLEKEFEEAAKFYDPKYLEKELRKCQRNFEIFKRKAERAGAFVSQEEIQKAFAAVAPKMADIEIISKALAFANSEEPGNFLSRILSSPADDPTEYIREIESEVFQQEDIVSLPVFIDGKLNWHIFRLEGKFIIEYDLRENGDMTPTNKLLFDEIALIGADEGAKQELARYLEFCLARDFFYDVAALAAMEENFERPMSKVYLELLAQTALSVWWRASLIAKTRGLKTIDRELMKDGIVFFDADFLDSDSIGEFI